jgi:hypothetical protein
LNDFRVKVAHGDWSVEGSVSHVSRQKLVAERIAGMTNECEKQADEAMAITDDLEKIWVAHLKQKQARRKKAKDRRAIIRLFP